MPKFIVLLLVVLFPSLSFAASFDCARAATKMEKLICSDPQLSKSDEELAASYSKALKEASDPGAIKKQQREWLGNVRNRCDDVTCLRDAYASRTTQLASGKNAVPPPAPLQAASGANNQPEQYQTDQGVANVAQIASDRNGNVMVIWPKRAVGNVSEFKLAARSYAVGNGWGAEHVIYVKKPQIAANERDDEIMAAHYIAGKGWKAPVKGWDSPEPIGTFNNEPTIATDEHGSVMVVWSKLDPHIFADRYIADKAWFGGNNVGRVFVTQGQLLNVRQSVRDARGNVITVWQDLINSPDADPNRPGILTNRYTAGKVWGESQQIKPDDIQRKNALIADVQRLPPQGPRDDDSDESPRVEWVSDLKIAMDQDGNAIVVQSEQYGRFDNIWAHRYDAATGLWGKAQRISNHGSQGVTITVDIAMGTSGNAVVTWGQGGQIWARSYVAKKGWGEATMIGRKPDGIYAWVAIYPRVAVDDNGNAMVAWQDFSASEVENRQEALHYRIYAARYVTGKGWEAATAIEHGGASAEFPRVAMDAQGNATVVWWKGDGKRYYPVANRYEVGKGWQTPIESK